MIRKMLEQYRYKLLSGVVLLCAALVLFLVLLPIGNHAVGFLGEAMADVDAYEKTSSRTLPPDSLVARYRALSARIAAFGSGKPKPSDILQQILHVASSHKVVLQDMSTRDPVAGSTWIEYPVNMRARGNALAILGFLTDLENGAQCVSVASVLLSPTAAGVEASIALSVFTPGEGSGE